MAKGTRGTRAKRKKSSKQNRWHRRRWYAVPIIIGLIAFLLNVFVLKQVSIPVQNLLNWTTGLGFVGGLLTLTVDIITVGKHKQIM